MKPEKPLPPDDNARKSKSNQPFDASDPKITRRRALKRFVAYSAPAAIALLTARDAAAAT